jgi:hypothetical protein
MIKAKVVGSPRVDAKAEYLEPIDFSFKDLMNLQGKNNVLIFDIFINSNYKKTYFSNN